VELARRRIAEGGKPADVAAELQKAQRDIEEQKRREEARRAALTAMAKFSVQRVNPFDVFEVQPVAERGWDRGKKLTEKQAGLLRKQGIEPDGMPYGQARQLLNELFRRWDGGLCSLRQAAILRKHGLPVNVTREEASRLLDGIAAKEGWKR
jgi:hypothetical protein